MKAKEIREMNTADIESRLNETLAEIQKYNFDRAIKGQVDNPARKRLLKRDVARLRTILKEKLAN
jgi:large subunit ribosomal protein L29